MHPLEFVVRIDSAGAGWFDPATRTSATATKSDGGSTIGVPYSQRKLESDADPEKAKK